jgi:hypothetical protein
MLTLQKEYNAQVVQDKVVQDKVVQDVEDAQDAEDVPLVENPDCSECDHTDVSEKFEMDELVNNQNKSLLQTIAQTITQTISRVMPKAAYEIKYVPMPMPEKPTPIVIRIQSNGNKGIVDFISRRQPKFWNRVSRGKINMTSIASYTISKPRARINKVNKLLEYIPGRHNAAPVIGQPIAANHETGHEFGLDHSDSRFWEPGSQTTIRTYQKNKDPFSPMTSSNPGAPTLNPPHLHRLGWFNPKEIAFAENQGSYDMLIFFDQNKINLTSLKVLYYQVPNSTRKYWFFYNGLENGRPGIIVHSAEPNKGNRGLTYYEAYAPIGKTHPRTGLIFEILNAKDKTATVLVNIDPSWTLQGT